VFLKVLFVMNNQAKIKNVYLVHSWYQMIFKDEDQQAKLQVEEIAKSWGWKDIVDLGSISESFYMEAFALLWISYAFKNNSWTHAFSLLIK
jgi:8-hydroxy-5-deazaflavin:NADPH oxidoreductase